MWELFFLLKGIFVLVVRFFSELFLFVVEGVNFIRSTIRIIGEYLVVLKGDEGKL